MSLINDALKRGSVKSTPNPDLPAAVPVVDHEDGSGVGAAAKFALILVLGAIIAVVWFQFGRGPKPPQTAGTAAPATNKTAANPVERARDTLNKVAARNTEGSETAENIQAKTAPAQPAPTQPAPAPAAKVEPAAPAEFPPVRLQAIFFSATRPTAILNGKTVGPGQIVDRMKVLSIGRASVEVEFQGMKKTLSLK